MAKSIKDILLENKENFRRLKGDMSPYYTHTVLSPRVIDDQTISIVMTASDRTKQLYFTLLTIQKSVNKNIHLVIVDDSPTDPVNKEVLEKTGLFIDLVEIDRSKKFWVNPCVNYNIGFSFIKGNRVVIQNSEVCHVGDVLDSIADIYNDAYYVFDVLSSKGFAENERMYGNVDYLTVDILSQSWAECADDPRQSVICPELFDLWFQHHKFNPREYHFLTFTSRKTLEKIGGFNIDYAFAVAFDDDDFILRLFNANVQIVNINSKVSKILGIHLYHALANTTEKHMPTHNNNEMWIIKKKLYLKNKEYIEVSKNLDMFELVVEYLFKK